jgi:serine O-acetyltransferase
MVFWNLGIALVRSVHDYSKYKDRQDIVAGVLRRYARMRHLVLSILTASDIDPNVKLGARLKLPHPNGVVVHGNAVIGDDCMIMQQVTIGQLAGPDVPVIGSSVYIGAGAKILGKVTIGNNARIGSNAVVLRDVPADHTAVGVPAEPRPTKNR